METKNGAVLRKQLGYAYIPQKSAERLNQFNRDFLNVYINFHRPCFFPVAVVDRKGKVRKTYPYEEVRTPYEKLMSLPKAEDHLRPGVSFESLDADMGAYVQAKGGDYRNSRPWAYRELSCA